MTVMVGAPDVAGTPDVVGTPLMVGMPTCFEGAQDTWYVR